MSIVEKQKLIGQRIRQAREYLNMSQEELGGYYGCSDAHISRIEKGMVKLGVLDIERFVSILRQPFDWFINDIDKLPYQSPPQSALADLELSIRAFIPVYDKIPTAGAVQPIDWIALTRIKPSPKSYIGYRVKGLYLEPDIKDGDTLIVDIERTPNNGDLVICILEGQASVKRYHDNGTDKWLEDNKGKFQLGNVSILGVIIEYNRKYPF